MADEGDKIAVFILIRSNSCFPEVLIDETRGIITLELDAETIEGRIHPELIERFSGHDCEVRYCGKGDPIQLSMSRAKGEPDLTSLTCQRLSLEVPVA